MSDPSNAEIEAYCGRKGLTFRPWEYPRPWEVREDEPCPYPANSGGGQWWPRLMEIRARIVAELRAEAARIKTERKKS